ncbi:MAG: VPLPA-CTERM sorting domain-containing protein [Pseudomonadota bacterium]
MTFFGRTFTSKLSLAAIVAGVTTSFAGMATAATVSFVGLSTADLDALTPASNPLASSTTGTVLENITGNQPTPTPPLTARSPWEGSAFELTGEYTSVQSSSSATFTFAGKQSGLELIWGSPDSFNDLTITLFTSGTETVINGSAVQGPSGILASSVVITDVVFETIKFESGQNAFEFANLSTTPVPLPAGMLLMGTALAGFGVMRRRRKSS